MPPTLKELRGHIGLGLSVYLSINLRILPTLSRAFLTGSVVKKGKSKSMTASLQTDDRLNSRSTKVRVIKKKKTDFVDKFTLKNRGWRGL